ncbi:prolactin regulatory element-binding protein, partial [Tremellales sp. Uapishka_1]
MTRTAHHPHPTPAFPVYCLDWADDDTLIMGGGGGASRSGIINKLKLCKVSKDGKKIDYANELHLSMDEDAPMTMDVDRSVGACPEHAKIANVNLKTKQLITGINASSSSIKEGSNQHCRVFSYADEKLALVRGQNTIHASWSDDYPWQKFTTLSPSGSLLAVGSTDNRIAILRFPSLEPVWPSFQSGDGELVDLDWGGEGGEWLAVTTTSAILLYHATDGDIVRLHLRQTIFPPTLDISPVVFRAARFSPTHTSPPAIHAALNATKKPSKRGAPVKAFICTFGVVAAASKAPITPGEKDAIGEKTGGKEPEEVGKWDVIVRREVAGKPITVLDVSENGKLLSYGCSDLSIGILDSKTLTPLLKILHSHSFPPTALKFNPSASLLVSASADNTIRVVMVPARFGGVSLPLVAFLLAILAIIAAMVMRG